MKIRNLNKDNKGILICCFNCGSYQEQSIWCHKNKEKVKATKLIGGKPPFQPEGFNQPL